MKILITLFTFFIFFTIHAQENATHCAKKDAFSNSQMKSNTLNINQIEEAKKYNVHFYTLDLEMDNLVTDVAGTVGIYAIANETLDSALFELFSSFTITEIRVNGAPTTYSRNGSAIKVPVNISAGQNFKIEVDYSGTPPNASTNPLGGAGMTNASSPSWGNQVTWSLSEPFSAFEWWPCKQDLRDKADSVSVKITVPNNCKAGSNGILENVVDLGNGTSRYEWVHRHPIVYYLVSVAVGEYVEYNVTANPAGSANPVLIQNYIYNNPSTLPYFQNDIDETVDFMELFADLYGPYPFDDEKYGHCMAPLSGGMEHQTMTTQGFFEKGLTAHELGHQWWGDHVTCASWTDIWINEGFASYSEYLMLENLYPNDAYSHMDDVHDDVMTSPNGSIWIEDSLNDAAIFSGRLTYNKGAAFVHTLRFIMNDDVTFFQALKNFQTDFADSVAMGLDIKDHLEAVSSIDFDPAFGEWFYGEGFPRYSMRWNNVGNDLYFEVTHTTSSTTPTFTNPLEIRFSRVGAADTTVRVSITGNQNHFMIPNIGDIASNITIDPNNWIINKVGPIINDANFTIIDEFENKKPFTVYPNPSNGMYNIEIDHSAIQNINVYSVSGKLIHSQKANTKTTLDLTSFDAGYYILKLNTIDGQQWIQTLVKE